MKRKKLILKTYETKVEIKSELKSAAKQEEVKNALKRKMETNGEQISNKLSKTSVDVKQEITDSMETEDSSEVKSVAVDTEMPSDLPNDFFDDKMPAVEETKQITDSNEEEKVVTSEANSLPKGFFDDPQKDAKARKVVYKNPIDEQWEQFQKVIAEETNVSENIIEEDIEEIQKDRNLEEIEEQIANWIKVNEMQKRAEMLRNHIISNSDANRVKKEEDSDSDVDEQDLNVFSNWRSRTALK